MMACIRSFDDDHDGMLSEANVVSLVRKMGADEDDAAEAAGLMYDV